MNIQSIPKEPAPRRAKQLAQQILDRKPNWISSPNRNAAREQAVWPQGRGFYRKVDTPLGG